MSLLPLLYSNWWEDLDRPHTLLDQHFGLGINPENLPLIPSSYRHSPSYYTNGPRSVVSPRTSLTSLYVKPSWTNFLRQGQLCGASTVKADKDQFQVSLDVQQFTPDEINVKVVDRTVIVEGKHEEKQDEHGWVSRQFIRRYMIPEQCDIEEVASKLSSDGVLSITVPRKNVPKVENERSIKIEQTGKPAVRENGDVEHEIKNQGQQEEEDEKK